MGAMEVERLVLKSAFVKESLAKSDAMTAEMISILSSFDDQLSSLEAAMRPTQIRTHALTKAHQNIDHTLQAAESVLAQFDVSRQVEPRLLEGPKGDLDSYFAAVDQLQTAVDFFSQNRSYKSSDAALHHARGLLTRALAKLEEEFRRTLAANSKSQDPAALFAMLPEKYKPSPPTSVSASEATSNVSGRKPPNSSNDPPPEKIETLPLIPPQVIPQLHGMAKQLLAGGFSQQCTKAYKDVRGATILQSLKRLGLEKLSREEVTKMQWEVLETKIGSWIQVLRIAVKLLLASERKLSDQVFYRLDPDRTAVFCEVAAESMATLLSFGDSVAKSKRSPEKLFVLLDMYETLRDLVPDVDVTFSGEACATIREAAKGLLKRISETALGTFAEFEDAVDKDVSKHSVADGTVHPLTSYVINYVKYLLDYQSTLKELFGEGDVDKQASQLAVAAARILGVLQQNLDGKSRVYKNPALTQLFMMNNMHYMVRSVKRSEARELLGDDWVQRHRRTVQQHATAYQRSSWGRVTTLLTGQGLQAGGSEGAVNRQAVKDRFKAFNTTFEELYASQTQWVIPDPELREAVRLQVAEVLLPAYRSFLKRYGTILEGGKNPGKYIKYAPEDLERMLGDFFEGGNRR